MPPAVACLNPHRPDCALPYSELCATGFAFLLIAALRRKARDSSWFASRPEPDLRESLDLVALATVADMVPLQSVNRIFVASGLDQLKKARRPGLRALMEVSKTDPGSIQSSDLGFRLGPEDQCSWTARPCRLGRRSHANKVPFRGSTVGRSLRSQTCDDAKSKAIQ